MTPFYWLVSLTFVINSLTSLSLAISFEIALVSRCFILVLKCTTGVDNLLDICNFSQEESVENILICFSSWIYFILNIFIRSSKCQIAHQVFQLAFYEVYENHI